jgi:acyl-CoA dehydrogenase
VTETDNIVAATAERIFADLADAQTINGSKDDRWKAPLWHALSEAGLPLAWVPESHGGAGVSLAEGFSVISAAGRFAIGAPLVETMLAGWLLAQAHIASPDGAMTIAPISPRDRLTIGGDGAISGRARGVPFGSEVNFIAVLVNGADGAQIALLDAKACSIERGFGLGGDASDTITFDRTAPRAIAEAPAGLDRDAPLLMGAVARSLQIAGALETMLEISVRYANERVAFGRKIGQFQAVQHDLAKLAGEAAAALAAASSAADAISRGARLDDDGLFLEAAAAKIRCAEAAEKGAAIAHQVHGAIGFSSEHVLHRYTMRALAWRDNFGNESFWAVELGKRIAVGGADALWPLVASR